ncbi:MAG: family oxidoreductase [Hydrocarboniphaga sp.]|nr:family oxidoreductase [Hydrocarboniphaga sp.]
MNLGLSNKVVLVTGGSTGIGRAIAIAFAEAGAKLVIAARNADKGNEVARFIGQAGGECLYVKTDVSKSADVSELLRKTIDRYGRLDCAINNAAVEGQKGFLDWTEAEWDEMVDINLKGVWLCMKNEITAMLEQGGGAIVNISSVAGLIGFPLHAPYVAAKHGVMGLTKAASVEFAKQGIRVNTICPGTILTPMLEQGFANNRANAELATAMTPMGRLGQPHELAAAALWLCSGQSSFVTGATLSVDGGWSQH